MSSNEGNINDIFHVTVKAPPFMETAVSGWFQILEAQFSLRNINNNETKFFHVLANLPPETVSRVPSNILENHHFSELKNFVKELYEKTKPELFEKLISATSMTGKPSTFLHEIQLTASKVGVTDDLVRHKFIQALPSSISPVIAAQKDLTIAQIGKLADELMPFSQQQQCFAIPKEKKLSYDKFRRDRDNFTIPMGLKPFKNDQRPRICRFHLYFAEKAKHCKPWCRWPNKQRDLNIQPSSRASSPTPSGNSLN